MENEEGHDYVFLVIGRNLGEIAIFLVRLLVSSFVCTEIKKNCWGAKFSSASSFFWKYFLSTRDWIEHSWSRTLGHFTFDISKFKWSKTRKPAGFRSYFLHVRGFSLSCPSMRESANNICNHISHFQVALLCKSCK